MGTERKGRTEVIVGIFLFAGLAVLGILIVTFGRLGQGLSSPYELTVLFQNANGLPPGADILLSGAKIGIVDGSPQLVGDSYRVAIRLKVQGNIRIPRKSKFAISSANLLGDKYIDVVPLDQLDPNDCWTPGEIIEGSRSGGFDDLALRGSAVLDQLTESLKDIQNLTTTLNRKLLSESNIQNIENTLSNLHDTSATFKKTSLSIDSVVNKADTFLTSADATIKTFDSAGKDIRLVVAELKNTAERTNKAAESIQKLTKGAADGKGSLGLLMNDKETAENLRSFIQNLRKSGILFYKDRPAQEEKKGR